MCEVVDVVPKTKSVSVVFVENNLEEVPQPGQFVMVWVYGVDEIPMAISHFDSTRIGITVNEVGECTKALRNVRKGESIGLRGYFGRGFTTSASKALLIGGGVGIAPLTYLSNVLVGEGAEVVVCFGVKSGDELILVEDVKGRKMIATEDGSQGVKGTVIRLLDLGFENLNFEKFDRIYCCGPEKMMFEVFKRVCEHGMLQKCEFSLHRYFKCGMGVCGSCCIDPHGWRVCKEGPIFRGDEL